MPNIVSFYPAPISFSPNILTPSVSTKPDIKVTYNVELAVDQINSDVKLNQYIILIEESTDQAVPVTFVSYTSRILQFTSAHDLNPGSTYQVTLLSTIQSAEGRVGQTNRSFVFKVDQTSIPQVVLIDPANFTSSSTTPIFSWFPVSMASSGSTGTLLYRVQLDDNIAFNSVLSHGWTTLTINSSAIPGVSLLPSTNYFWQVRAELYTASGSSVGMWSDPFVWYYGTFLQPSPSTRQTYPDAVPFQISTSYTLESGLSNYSGWPLMKFKFSADIDPNTINSDNIYMTGESVDGWPTSNRFLVGLNYSVSGSILLITTSAGQAFNTRFTLWLTTGVADINGNHLSENVSYYFTSRYSPVYLGINVLRANFGQFLIRVPDDILNMQIYRMSLEVNREWILYYNPLVGGPTQEQVRNITFPFSWAMEKWVEHEMSAQILTMRMYELIEVVDSMKRLGDYQEQHGYNILKALEEEIKRQRQLATKYIPEFSRHRARPKSMRKSERYPAWNRATDYSSSGFLRNQI